MISFLVIHAVIGIVLTPKTQGKTLEQIERERYGESANSSVSITPETNTMIQKGESKI